MPAIVLIRGGGDLASGVALRLFRTGLNIVITEMPLPLTIRRTVSFAQAVYEGQATVEGVTARSAKDPKDPLGILNILTKRQIPVIVDPDGAAAEMLHPLAIIDARMLKQPPEPLSHHALLYVGLGPGFAAPHSCHAVIETQRGHTLGRVIWTGGSLDDTSRPKGDSRRVLRAPTDGTLRSSIQIGAHLEQDQPIASIDGHMILAPFKGVLRGLLRPGLSVHKGMKIGDLDSRDDPRLCDLVSDKSLAVGGGVLEALLTRPEIRARLWV